VEVFALLRLAEQVAPAALDVGVVVRVHLHARVHDGDHVEAPSSKLRDERAGVGEAFVVPGEDPVAVHVVYVEVEGVAGDVALAEPVCQLAHLTFGLVAPAALLVPQRPEGGHRGAAGQLGVAVQDVAGGGAAEDVVDEVAALGPVIGLVFVLAGEVHLDAVGVVEEQAVSVAVGEREHEGDGGVEVVVGGGVPGGRIHVPEHL
jgi:hypothetical protein